MSDNDFYRKLQKLSELEKKTLIHIYSDFVKRHFTNGIEIPCLLSLPLSERERYLNSLEDAGFIEGKSDQYFLSLVPELLLPVEAILLVDDPEVIERRKIRSRLLLWFAESKEKNGSYSFVSITEIKELQFGREDLDSSLHVLESIGWIQTNGPHLFRITSNGYEEALLVRRRLEFEKGFMDLDQLVPQRRGIEFQKFLGCLLEFQEWRQQEGVKTEEEEIDVVINRGFEYFLFECKWEKDPIGAAVIREFFGKLFKRSQTKGIVVSYSGFTGPAAIEAANFFSHRPILLMGPEDIKELVSFKRSFDEIVAERYDLLVTKRISIFR